MSKLALSFVGAAGIAASFVVWQAPVEAQAQNGEIIVYGNDPCPRSTDDEVVVCARRPEAERYRIPEAYRSGGPRQLRESWAVRARRLQDVGDTGINSCSAVGPAAHTGCLEEMIDRAAGEAGEAAAADTPPM